MRLTDVGVRELRREFEEFKRKGFPRGNAPDQEARSLHGDLVLYDAYIAGLLTRLINGGDIEVNSLYTDETLKGRLEEYGGRRSDARPFVEDRLRRLDDIHRLIKISRECVAEP